MFFQIGPAKDNFPFQYTHKNLVVNLDQGWTETCDSYGNKLFYKGYADDYDIKEILENISNQEEPLYTGNFCVIKCFDKGITVKADRYRSFPLWYSKKEGLTNLYALSWKIWADSYAMITLDSELVESKFNLIPDFETSYLSFDQVVDHVDCLLKKKIKNFIKFNSLPLKSFLTGGIDTGLLYSYLHKLKIPNELVTYTHMDFDYFYMKNHVTLMKFWGYSQIHHWKEHCVILTGAPGDEFTVRSPYTVNMMLKYYDSEIPKLLSEHIYHNSLHKEYFRKEEYDQIWEEQKNLKFDSLKHVICQCLNLIVNDHQHWHLGNTITWTPLKDIEFFITIARLCPADLKDHIMNSTVQKELIKRNFPELLSCLSTNKNSGNYMENLVKIIN